MVYNVLQSMIKKLTERGHSIESAEKIGTKHLQTTGYVNKGKMNLTDLGKEMSVLTQADRARMRKSRQTGRPAHHYIVTVDGKVKLNPIFK